MARISTGTGDEGMTSLVGGQRVPKSAPRVSAYGAVDEANDTLGLAAAHTSRPELKRFLEQIQADLFTLGSDLAAPDGVDTLRIGEAHVAALVREEDRIEAALPPLRTFILPGGTPAAAFMQLARSMVRRAEREAWGVAAQEPVNRHALVYLNRLSDLLFLMAREENHLAGVTEPAWKGRSG